jgi:hypothetical protein
MAIYRATISFQMGSSLPRDAVTINPHYFGDDAQGLADRLKANLIAHAPIGATTPFKVSVYDAQKAPPNFPLAVATQLTGFRPWTKPQEVAACLSYYSTWNRPRYRGRLYIPAEFLTGTLADKPTTTQMNDVLAWKTPLTTGLPAGTNWVVFSRRNNQSYGVDHIWCDNEWDTVRSRGVRASTRVLGVVP